MRKIIAETTDFILNIKGFDQDTSNLAYLFRVGTAFFFCDAVQFTVFGLCVTLDRIYIALIYFVKRFISLKIYSNRVSVVKNDRPYNAYYCIVLNISTGFQLLSQFHDPNWSLKEFTTSYRLGQK